MTIKNKVAIVTGASMGIGEAAARLLTQKGAKVALVARSKERLEKLSKELPESFVVICDVTDPIAIKEMIRKVVNHYETIDILINNAGRGYDATVENINVNTFKKLFDLDLVGPVVAMQEVIPLMRKGKGGAIVNISSGTALMAIPNMAAYSSLKRALVGISLTAREELKSDKITVGVVYPFITDTNFEKNTIKNGEFEQQSRDEERGFKLPDADSAEFVAKKIVEAIETGKGEIFVHDWMKK